MKKGISVVISLFMILCLVSCGNSVPTLNENDIGESTEEFDEIIDKVESDMEAEEETTATVNKEEEAEATATPTQAPVSTPTPTAEPTPEPTATPEPTEPPHSHQYAETITRQPSCLEAGEKTLICSCGNTKVEAIPATDNHDWVEGTTTIHHEAIGHVETTEVQVQVGTTTRTEYECAVCGHREDSPDVLSEHRASFAGVDRAHATARTIAYDYSEPVYEMQTQTVWVVDQNPWDETIGNGVFTCSACGATK